ncbi:MAG: DUF1294 domain-containing protein [Lachnospiraceae bacterium]|nr:DUF1294 domain-containing protein [Lachnospiraceae bacterium]
MAVMIFVGSYFLILNIIGFVMMGIDKRKAIKGAFRIPETTLFIVALIGGSIGSICGMYTFRHKTRKWRFVYGMPLILFLQLVLLILLFFYSPFRFLTI